MFIGSAPTVGTAHKGVERPRVWLGTAVPGDTVGNFGPRSTCSVNGPPTSTSKASRYWYDTQASVTRTAADIADRLREHPEDVWVEIVRRLRDQEGRAHWWTSQASISPRSTGDVPDTDVAQLVILAPEYLHKRNSLDSQALEFADELVAHRRFGPADQSQHRGSAGP